MVDIKSLLNLLLGAGQNTGSSAGSSAAGNLASTVGNVLGDLQSKAQQAGGIGGIIGTRFRLAERIDKAIAAHPDTHAPIAGRVIPHWDAILHMAARFCDLTGLGYLGVDIVIDRMHGPMMLEVNARPGLQIQVINGVGLSRMLAEAGQ